MSATGCYGRRARPLHGKHYVLEGQGVRRQYPGSGAGGTMIAQKIKLPMVRSASGRSMRRRRSRSTRSWVPGIVTSGRRAGEWAGGRVGGRAGGRACGRAGGGCVPAKSPACQTSNTRDAAKVQKRARFAPTDRRQRGAGMLRSAVANSALAHCPFGPLAPDVQRPTENSGLPSNLSNSNQALASPSKSKQPKQSSTNLPATSAAETQANPRI